MNRLDDPAYAYIDKEFPGRKFIAVGILPWALYWFSSLIVRWDELPTPYVMGTGSILAISAVVYLIGYWKALQGKGYPLILMLAAFTGIIGLVVILFLPDRKDEMPDEHRFEQTADDRMN